MKTCPSTTNSSSEGSLFLRSSSDCTFNLRRGVGGFKTEKEHKIWIQREDLGDSDHSSQFMFFE